MLRSSAPSRALSLVLLLAACRTPQAAPPASVVPASAAPSPAQLAPSPARLVPPVAQKRPHEVQAHAGTRSDPYYWLRDDSRTDPDVLAYLRAENAYKEAQMAPLACDVRALRDELVGRMPPADSTVPVRERGYDYYARYVPEGEYAIHARRRAQADAPEEVLLDGNALAHGLGFFRLGSYEISDDNQLLAYAADTVGRGQHTVRFKDLRTGALLPDVIENAEDEIAWASDGRTLLYIEKNPETLLGFRVRAHRLGSPVASDRAVYEEADSAFYLHLWRSRSGRYLSIYAQSTVSSEQWLAAADDPSLKFQRLLPREKDHEYLVEDAGTRFVLRSNRGAPNFRVLEAPLKLPLDPARFRELVPSPVAGVLEDFEVYRDFLAYTMRDQGMSRVFVMPWKGRVSRALAVPEAASTALLGDNPEPQSATLRIVYSSLTTPRSVFAYDVAKDTRQLLKQDAVLGGFSADDYTSELRAAPARDGRQIPVSIVYRKGVKRDGKAGLYETGYGAYGLSEDPEFSSSRLSLLDRGVVFAIAHVRGGQELGRAWYDGGRLLNKQTTFTDFVDVRDFLVREGYAAASRVAARGASAGGLLMGAVANMAPEKYRVIVAHVPFVDVVTTMLDESIPLTTNEYDEWGDPRQPAFYEAMRAYSPYDNVRAQAYPALFVSTGLWDSQVQYYEPAKWVARLRAHKTDHHPLLLRVNMEAGHGGRSGRFVQKDELAEEYAFVLHELAVQVTSAPCAR